MQTFENLLLQNHRTISQILYTNGPWVCLIKICSNGGATYIIGKITAQNNLNMDNLKCKTFGNLLLQNY